LVLGTVARGTPRLYLRLVAREPANQQDVFEIDVVDLIGAKSTMPSLKGPADFQLSHKLSSLGYGEHRFEA
jgi:hypothetical protein